MSANFSLETGKLNDVNVTLVGQDDSEIVRACLITPFNPLSIVQHKLPYEVPHLLEHVVLCGGVDDDTSGFKDSQMAFGGTFNGKTFPQINGVLSFETTQPDDAEEQVIRFVKAVLEPGLRATDLQEQRNIVRNELLGYIQNPERQRNVEMNYRQGEIYTTNALGLSNLDSITGDDLQKFHREFFTLDNMRFVFSGELRRIYDVATKLAEVIGSTLPKGTRYLSRDNSVVDHPDYHASANEIPEGLTEYAEIRAVRILPEFYNRISSSELLVCFNAFIDFLCSGNLGLHDMSRSLGLSYGVKCNGTINLQQMSISISDTTSIDHVKPQITLLDECLKRVEEYTTIDFEEYRRKFVGSKKLNPEYLHDFSYYVERMIPSDRLGEVLKPEIFRKIVEEIDSVTVTFWVRNIAYLFREPEIVNRYSFGTNPFETYIP